MLGYKGYVIKNNLEVHFQKAEPWKVTLIVTAENTQTVGRLKRVYEYLRDEEFVSFAYFDGLSNVDISKQIQLHKEHVENSQFFHRSPYGVT